MQKSILDFIGKIIPVMIGVYLGFVVSNWAERGKKRKQKEVFVKNLLSEANANLEQLELAFGYHKLLRDSSLYYAYSGAKLVNHNFFNGLGGVLLMNSAYNTGIQTGTISELSLEEIQHINQLYTFQDGYNDYQKLMLSEFISMDFTEEEEDINRILRFLSLTMTDVVNMEENLITLYKEIPKKLDQP